MPVIPIWLHIATMSAFPWKADVNASNQIHSLRQLLGTKRQPEWSDALYRLNEILAMSGRTDPYSAAAGTELEAEIRSLAANGSDGAPGEWLFSICSTSKLSRCTEWRPLWVGWPAWKTHDALIRRYRQASSWLELSAFASGETRFPLGICWFSDEEPNDNLVCAGHSRGMPNIWIQTYSVVIRCRSKDVAELVQVPTVIDGFLSPIFLPTETAAKPSAGMAISLEMYPTALEVGLSEWVLPNIPVSALQIKPVTVTSAQYSKHSVSLIDNALWMALESFYRNALSKRMVIP